MYRPNLTKPSNSWLYMLSLLVVSLSALFFSILMTPRHGVPAQYQSNSFTTETYDGHRYVIYRGQSGGIAMTLHPEDGK